jgi:hypothetical protein
MVSSTRCLLTCEGGGLGEDLVHLEAGLEANRTCAGEQEVQREGLVWR